MGCRRRGKAPVRDLVQLVVDGSQQTSRPHPLSIQKFGNKLINVHYTVFIFFWPKLFSKGHPHLFSPQFMRFSHIFATNYAIPLSFSALRSANRPTSTKYRIFLSRFFSSLFTLPPTPCNPHKHQQSSAIQSTYPPTCLAVQTNTRPRSPLPSPLGVPCRVGRLGPLIALEQRLERGEAGALSSTTHQR